VLSTLRYDLVSMHDSISAQDLIRSGVKLGRVANLSLRLRSTNEVFIQWDGGEVRCGIHGLGVLNAFSQPRSVREVLQLLSRDLSGVQDWQDLTRTILLLYANGVLQEATAIESSLTRQPKGFDKPQIHIRMLNDRRRTWGLMAAIRETIRPGDVVLDIGTGTGVLAIAAALAGARHVYAIEAGAIGRVAREVVEANQLQDRITVIEGWSTQVQLPELADVFVSEIIGNDPFAERVLESTLDARRRLLKDGARQIPQTIEVWALPVHIPSAQLRENRFTPELQKDWLDWYGINFEPLVGAGAGNSSHFFVEPHSAREWQNFADPVHLSQTDLRTFSEVCVAGQAIVPANKEGEINGLMLFFRCELNDGLYLSTDPAGSSEDNSWQNRVEILSKPLFVRPGDKLAIHYHYQHEAYDCGIAVVA
jgi:16S rRNA G966 N2-methylase RsmD